MNIRFHNYEYKVVYSRYVNNQRIAISLIDPVTHEVYLIATVNLIEEDLQYNEVAIKEWSENVGILEALIQNDIISEPHRVVNVGFTKAYICYLNDGLEIINNLLSRNAPDDSLSSILS